MIQKADFGTLINYPDFWVTLLSIPDCRNLSQKVISVLVRMPINYFANKEFLVLSKLNQKRETQSTMFIYKNQLRVLQFRYGIHEHTLQILHGLPFEIGLTIFTVFVLIFFTFTALDFCAGFLKRDPRPLLGTTERFSGDHEQRPSLGSFM